MIDVENEVFGTLKPHGLKDRSRVKALRVTRNAVAHHGSIPSGDDAQRHAAAARTFASLLVQVAWGADLNCLTAVSLVDDPEWRSWLEAAYSLLHDPDFELVTDAGQQFDLASDAYRTGVAAGLARWVWDSCNGRVLWSSSRRAIQLFPHLDRGERMQRDLQQNYAEREAALRTDVLALHLGVRQPDLDRFLDTTYSPISLTYTGRMSVTHRVPPSTADAQFAVDFVVDWVLRAQQHVR